MTSSKPIGARLAQHRALDGEAEMIQPRLKHLRHPLRTLRGLERVVSIYREIGRLGDLGAQYYRGDPRYNLNTVSEGFASRTRAATDDSEILKRICAAYICAAQHEKSASATYQPTEWWLKIRQTSLRPVMQALATRDICSLNRIYGNFFRNACSAGLNGVPFGMKEAYFGRRIKDLHRRYFLADALHAIDCWQEQTGRRFALHTLRMPETGNPFGVMVDGTLVQPRAAYHHVSAQRVIDCLGSGPASVVEIGGGYGAMAYFLLRDRPATTYIGLDLPESLALTAYYLMKAFPQLRFLLYGEAAPARPVSRSYDVVLMPLWEMESLPCRSADLLFSSHAISDVSEEVMGAYLPALARVVRGSFLYTGNARDAEAICRQTAGGTPLYQLAERRASPWNAHKVPAGNEFECLFTPVASHAEHRAEEVVA